MRFEGAWRIGEDGRLRPVVLGLVADVAGVRHAVPFLVDTGADGAVLTCDALALLGFDPGGLGDAGIEGVGGQAPSVTVPTDVWLQWETGQYVLFRGPLLAFTDPTTLETSVLGRDILNHFAVIVDRPGDVVCRLVGNHRYVVQGP
jgi:hypothetical protein